MAPQLSHGPHHPPSTSSPGRGSGPCWRHSEKELLSASFHIVLKGWQIGRGCGRYHPIEYYHKRQFHSQEIWLRWPWRVKMPTQNLLRLLLLLMLIMRNMLTTVWCRFGRWFGHKVKFLFRLWAQGFKVWSRFWSWCSGNILKLMFGHYFATDMMLGCGYEVQSWSRLWS